MRDNIRKPAPGHLPAALTVVLALFAAHATAQPAEERATSCTISRAILGERGLPTAEISTEQMEVVLVLEAPVLVIDARPYEEYAMGHIAEAKCVAPKPGLPMSQYTSDVGEIEKLTGGRKNERVV